MTTPAGLPAGDRDALSRFLIDTEAATHAPVLKTIERFTLAGDFRVRDATGETANVVSAGKKGCGRCSRSLGRRRRVVSTASGDHDYLAGNW